MEQQPPPVTIVNPSSAGTADLLDTGPDPWRPSRRQVFAVVASALVAALVAGLVVQVRHTRRESALDAAAVRDVSLTLDANPARMGLASDEVAEAAIVLANRGSLPVRVLGVRLVGEGYPEQAQDTLLLANTQLPFALLGRSCSPDVLTASVTRVAVRLRTSRGDVVRRTLELPPEVAADIAMLYRRACGYLPPEEALHSELLSATRQGRDVVAVVNLVNTSVLPLSLTELLPGNELRVRAGLPLPLALPPRTSDHEAPEAVELVLRLRVTDCQSYSAGVSYSEGGWGLLASVRSGQQEGQVMIPLVASIGDYQSDPPDAARMLLEQCPGFFAD